MPCAVRDLSQVPTGARDSGGRIPGQVDPSIGSAADRAGIASPSSSAGPAREGLIYPCQVSQSRFHIRETKSVPSSGTKACNPGSGPATVANHAKPAEAQSGLLLTGNKLVTPSGTKACNPDPVLATVTLREEPAVEGSVLPASGEAAKNRGNQSITSSRPQALNHSLRPAPRKEYPFQ